MQKPPSYSTSNSTIHNKLQWTDDRQDNFQQPSTNQNRVNYKFFKQANTKKMK